MKVLKFSADWCSPCHMMKPIVKEVASELDVEVVEINTDEASDTTRRYGIRSIPTLVFVSDEGTEIGRVTGVTSKENLLSKMKEALGGSKD